MTQDACIVGTINQHPKEEDDSEEQHHRLDWHREFHLGQKGEIDSEGGKQCNGEQSRFEFHHKKIYG